MQSPHEAIDAGAICFRRAEKSLDEWREAYHIWVDRRIDYKRAYTADYDNMRSTGEAVKSCEIHAEQKNLDLERAMLLAEGDWKISKAAYELNDHGISLAQSSMKVLGAEMELSR